MAILNPRVDFAFKKLFGTPENKDILIAFINAIVSEEDQVADIVLLNPYNNKNYSGEKLSILDIKATDEKGRHYNIEMQITDQVYYNQRALYYWSKLYTSQLQSGDTFSDLKKTISINVLNFNYFSSEPAYHNVFKILNVASHQSYFEDLELHFIELDKFDKELSHIKTGLDRWANFLKKAQHYDHGKLPEELSEPAIEKAFDRLVHLSMNKEEQEIYEARQKWLWDEAAALEKAHEDGKKEGKAEGRAEGLQEGKQDIVKNLLSLGSLTLEAIAEAIGLSVTEIQTIKTLAEKQVANDKKSKA